VGARPQFIKAAVVARAFAARDDVREVLVHTGQHYDENMSGVFFKELGIPAPAVHLGVGSGSHGAQTGRMLEALEHEMRTRRPDLVLIYGDTNSTLAGALAAAKLGIPVAHVEAGLRSFNRAMPEEINRIVADRLSDLLFTPTDAADEHLRHEGISSDQITRVGDVMFDAVLHESSTTAKTIVTRLALEDRPFCLATIHRAENTDDPARLSAILGALGTLSGELPVVLPLHPRTRAAMQRDRLADHGHPELRLIEPLSYGEMAALEAAARVIVTDSGGVQKEAFFHGVPCVTVRTETEWTELVDGGYNHLASPLDAGAIADAVLRAVTRGRFTPPNLYGDGRAGERIVAAIVAFLDGRASRES
jgi:UDP-GlcNAc3NAcA epimerase